MGIYKGTTEASSIVNLPRLIAGRFQGVPATTALSAVNPTQASLGGNFWYYLSTNKSTAVNVAGFFTDGKKLGMVPGDLLCSVYMTTAASPLVEAQFSIITKVTSTGAGSTAGIITT